MRFGRLLIVVLLGLVLPLIILLSLRSAFSWSVNSSNSKSQRDSENSAQITSPVKILLDDFAPQPYQGQTVYYYNRLDGDRGALNNSVVSWGKGQVAITLTQTWGGIWFSLNHPITEKQSIKFSEVLPSPILPTFQSRITKLLINVAKSTPGKTLKLELKNAANSALWEQNIKLNGLRQLLTFTLPSLGEVSQAIIILDNATPNDFLFIERVSFESTTQITDVPQAAFVWSYGMLLSNWNASTGLIRDKAKDPSGTFDAIQSTGTLASATALAYQLGVIDRAPAISIVNKISDTLLLDVPRFHGLWPHWVITTTSVLTIATNTEWSSVDTVIAAIALLDAQAALGLDTSNTELMLRSVDWESLKKPDGISHGYAYSGTLISSTWDTFGGESWLVALAYAAARKQIAPIKYPLPPTANGSGFIDELAWLFVLPPSTKDEYGVDWPAYRIAATYSQTTYYTPTTCFSQMGLFGLSAAEVPNPEVITETQIYQPFGVGGQFTPLNDGKDTLGQPVVVPHYSAMIASIRPTEAISMWTWLINSGPFSPLNNVESLLFSSGPNCDPAKIQWNQLKGSWNLTLQTLGWGRYLANRQGQMTNLWAATFSNQFLRDGYLTLVPKGLSRTYLPLAERD